MSRPPRARARQPAHEPEPTVALLDPDDSVAPTGHVHVLEATEDVLPPLDRRTVVLLAQPGARRSAWLPRDLLTALGADVSSGGGRNYAETQYLAVVRLISEQVRDIVVLGAYDLSDASRLDLIHIAASAGCRLWLLHHPGTLERTDAGLLAWTDRLSTLAELQQAVAATAPDAARTAQRSTSLPGLPVTQLPAADWTFLVVAAERAMPDAYPAVLARWQAVQHRFGRELPTLDTADDDDDLRAFLGRLAGDAATAAELAVDVRAAQASAFRCGWHVRVNLTHLQATRSSQPPAQSRTPAMWRTLRLYPHPARGAAAALVAAGLTPAQAVRVPCGAVELSGDGATADAVVHEGERVPLEDGAGWYVAAQLLVRLGQGAQLDEPLLMTAAGRDWPVRGVTDVLGEVARDTGLLLDSQAGKRRATRADSLYTDGLSITRIGAALPLDEATPDPLPVDANARTAEPETLLDTRLLRQRRLALGLSQRQTASRIGVSYTLLRAAEDGTNHETLDLGVVVRLAETLGVTVDELLGAARRLPVQAADRVVGDMDLGEDTAVLGAALHSAGRLTPEGAVQAALGWDTTRLDSAARSLGEQVSAVGLRLVRRSGELGIVPIEAPAVRASTTELRRARYSADGMNATVAGILHAAVAAHLSAGRPVDAGGNAQRVAAGELVNAGVLEPDLTPSTATLDALFQAGAAGWPHRSSLTADIHLTSEGAKAIL